MRKTVSKILAAVMAAAVVVTMAPVDSQAAITADKEVVTYLAPNSTSQSSIYISGAKKSSNITDVKSSNAGVVKPLYTEKGGWEYKSLSKDWKPWSSSPSMYVGYRVEKVGTATLSYKVDGKSLTTKVTALKYDNPLKTLQIAGGANVASKFNKNTYVSAKKQKSTKKNATVKVAAASGWKITNVSVEKNENNERYEYYNWNKGASKVTLNVGTMTKGQYYISVSAKNTKTNGTVNVTYNMYQ